MLDADKQMAEVLDIYPRLFYELDVYLSGMGLLAKVKPAVKEYKRLFKTLSIGYSPIPQETFDKLHKFCALVKEIKSLQGLRRIRARDLALGELEVKRVKKELLEYEQYIEKLEKELPLIECPSCGSLFSSQEEKDGRKRVYQKRYRELHREERNKRKKEYHQELKRKVVEMYGGRCACCGETQLEFLTVDHIEGRTEEERKSRVSGSKLYGQLIKKKDPNIQILCWNCNCAKGFSGECPHAKC